MLQLWLYQVFLVPHHLMQATSSTKVTCFQMRNFIMQVYHTLMQANKLIKKLISSYMVTSHVLGDVVQYIDIDSQKTSVLRPFHYFKPAFTFSSIFCCNFAADLTSLRKNSAPCLRQTLLDDGRLSNSAHVTSNLCTCSLSMSRSSALSFCEAILFDSPSRIVLCVLQIQSSADLSIATWPVSCRIATFAACKC